MAFALSEPIHSDYFRCMKKSLVFPVLLCFLAACSNSSEPVQEKRSEQELIGLLHRWSKTDSLKIPKIDSLYTVALDEFIALYPSNPEHENFLFLAASHANGNQDHAKAAAYYAKYAEMYPRSRSHGDALFGAAFIYNNELQNYDSAKKYYETFLLLHPEHMLKDAAENELEHLGETPEELIEKYKKQLIDSTTEHP